MPDVTQPDPIRVLISAPYPSVRAGLRAMLNSSAAVRVVGEFASIFDPGEADLTAADALVIEVHDEGALTGVTGLVQSAATVLLAESPDVFRALAPWPRVPMALLLQGATADELVAAVQAVVSGLMVMDPAIATALDDVDLRHASSASGDVATLTPREREVLELVALGLPNKTIALRLRISEHTVKFHMGAILGKLGAASRTEAVTTAVRSGLLPL